MAEERDMEILLEVQKNSREVIRITLNAYKGFPFVDIRTWYAAVDGNLRPSQKGARFGVQYLPQIIAGLQKAHQKASTAKI